MSRPLVIGAGLIAILATGGLAGAQVPSFTEQQTQLRSANSASQEAQARAARLERAAAGERDQATQARAQEAAAAERIKAAQADVQAAQARIAIIDRLLVAQRTRLAERQGPILRLIAALQSMARRPAALGLVQPGSTQDMVHIRAVLGTTMPVVIRRSADVRAELTKVSRLRTTAESAVTALRDGRQRLEEQRLALVKLEADHRARSAELARGAMVESDRAMALGERAREIVDQMETAGDAATTLKALSGLAGPLPRPGSESTAAPAHAAPYRLPASGHIVSGLGELSGTGVRARGITLACAPGALAVAPAAGRIVYAGPFRDYGGVVIIDHGNGWTSLVAGLGNVAVQVGQQVSAGNTIGRAPNGDAPHLTVELRRRGKPMDLVQLLN